MLNDTTLIIENVPGKHLDPQLLLRSQTNDSLGFIMISYEHIPTSSDRPIDHYYDLLFFRGPQIYDCARMNQDLRFQIRSEVVFQTFASLKQEPHTQISLYTASDQVLSLFQSTLLYEPCLKVQTEGLTKKQVATLLKGTGCHRGIIECNQFIDPTPSIDLGEINSLDDIISFQPRFKHGRILVYDIEKNKELIDERRASQSKPSTQSATNIQNALDDKSNESSRSVIQFSKTSEHSVIDEEFSPVDEQEAEVFSSYIKQILNSPSLAQTNTSPYPPLQRRETRHSRRSPKPQLEKPSPKPQPKNHQPEPSEYTKLLERVFRSFRQQVLDSFGDKCDAVIANAEQKIQLLGPDFNLRSLNDGNAVLTLDLIEKIAAEAPFLKRSRLRQAALTLVADLYNKQYELLEKHGVIDKVEQCYYRLKK
jgi:hypothetical protein